jgi:hypothetical protein
MGQFSETDIIKMLEFLIDNIFVMFNACQQKVAFVWIPDVLFFSSTSSFIYMMINSCRMFYFSRKRN